MPVNTRKTADLKDEILSKIDDKFLKIEHLKIEVAGEFKNESKKGKT